MKAGDLVAGQYFKTNGCATENALKALPKDKMRPDKVLGQIVFIYSPSNIFHSSHVRILDLDDEVAIVNL
jgi:hypothetical protein